MMDMDDDDDDGPVGSLTTGGHDGIAADCSRLTGGWQLRGAASEAPFSATAAPITSTTITSTSRSTATTASTATASTASTASTATTASTASTASAAGTPSSSTPPPPAAQSQSPPPSTHWTTSATPTTPRTTSTAASTTPDSTRALHTGRRLTASPSDRHVSATIHLVADSPCVKPAAASTASQSTPTPQLPPAAALRKTSPGLAARLKALGFAADSKQPPSLHHESVVGRLDQQHLRQLDEKHQAASLLSTIARRGRPWKGNANQEGYSNKESNTSHSTPPEAKSSQLAESNSRAPLAVDMDSSKPTGLRPASTAANDAPSPGDADSINSMAPSPPRKDRPTRLPLTPPNATADDSSETDFVPGLSSYFSPSRNRPGSIYTLSRASFANQLAQLTSLQLPDALSLSSKVSAIRSAQVAAKALMNAAEQIQSWISKAQEVIGGLDSDDDVEWAAAGGRQGLHEVEGAITRFEDVIKAYVSAIEELQERNDISSVPVELLKQAVGQMERITDAWAMIRSALRNVASQVELAMEWEELWNSVLGDIQDEMEELSRLVFEMEERRHKATLNDTDHDDEGQGERLGDDAAGRHAKRMSIVAMAASPSSPPQGTPHGLSHDDSSLLALFARMQPLRASLDFLPMRLHTFMARADTAFPTACEELDMRRNGLDATYKKLEADAEALRQELGEDRWVIVFRGAGRQAHKMQQSVQRSLHKLTEALDAGQHVTNPRAMAPKIDSYEAKKMHYGPAIERVLAIVDKGVRDRLTVNGEILRLHADTQAAWGVVKGHMAHMDALLQRLDRPPRDSMSSLLSNDASTLASGHNTPGSSPPSSVAVSSLSRPKRRPRLSHIASPASRPASRSTAALYSTLAARPRWNASTNVANLDTGHNFKPLTLTTPSPYAAKSALPRPTPPPMAFRRSRLALRDAASSPAPALGSPRSLSKPRLATKGSMSALSAPRRTSMLPLPLDASAPPAPAQPPRPASSLAFTPPRSSLLPLPMTRRRDASTATPVRPTMPKAVSEVKEAVKPRWRP